MTCALWCCMQYNDSSSVRIKNDTIEALKRIKLASHAKSYDAIIQDLIDGSDRAQKLLRSR